MAINQKVLDAIVREAHGEQNVLDFLREILRFEANESGQYKKHYLALLEEYALKGDAR